MKTISMTGCALLLFAASAEARADLGSLPFYGESLDPNPVTGDLVALTLSADGSYRRRHCYVTPCIDAPTEIGTYTVSTSHGKQLIHFFNNDDDGTYEADKYEAVSGPSGELWLRRSGASRWVALAALADESLCDATGGHWRDDDPNPYTSLYCDCASGTYWNAAAGGCVNRPQ
jgi:hypothetical protein